VISVVAATMTPATATATPSSARLTRIAASESRTYPALPAAAVAPERAEQQCSPAVLVGDDPRERASQSDTQCRDRDEKPHEEPDVRGVRRVRFDRR
jgi:hypothetical protein